MSVSKSREPFNTSQSALEHAVTASAEQVELGAINSGGYSLSTQQFAKRYLVEAQTVLKQHSATGSYFGVRPVKLPNRLLLWPSEVQVKK